MRLQLQPSLRFTQPWIADWPRSGRMHWTCHWVSRTDLTTNRLWYAGFHGWGCRFAYVYKALSRHSGLISAGRTAELCSITPALPACKQPRSIKSVLAPKTLSVQHHWLFGSVYVYRIETSSSARVREESCFMGLAMLVALKTDRKSRVTRTYASDTVGGSSEQLLNEASSP